MRVVVTILVLTFTTTAIAQTPATKPATMPATLPAGVDDPVLYEQLVTQLSDAAAAKAKALEEMKLKLKELSDPKNPTANDAAKRDLLIRRRLADQQYDVARRMFDLYWLERSLTPEQKVEYKKLGPEDQMALLQLRTTEHRLNAPLPQKQFVRATVEEVISFISEQNEVRIVVDWPAVLPLGLQRRTAITLDTGRYSRTALNILQEVIATTTGGKASVDLSRAEAAIITTPAGLKLLVDMDRKLVQRVVDIRAWDNFGDVLSPVNLRQVPLGDALFANIPAAQAPALYVDWAGLAEAGITPKTPVDLILGPHTIGQRLAILADAMEERPELKRPRGVKFDVHPSGAIVFSTLGNFGRVNAVINRVLAAARTEEERDVLSRKLPEVRLEAIELEEALDFLKDAGKIDLRPDWKSLAACGYSPKTVIDGRFINMPFAVVLAMTLNDRPGKPEVSWEIVEQHMEVRGPKP